MALIAVDRTRGTLTVQLTGLDKLWALKSRVEVPLTQVRGATHDPGIVHERKGAKLGGTHMPGVITAGRFRRDGELVFWAVRKPAGAVVIELTEGAPYSRLVIGTADPRASVALVEQAIAAS
ncbi:hypothetical protein [Streptomyces sp. NBC_00059]|uniref:hypothetical protein n=1 Tax=Streptomyces sp. NBC_00059 TaxID=2975635 RepID=UPI0022552645|nr:hypothetical protein [Streptomyces sp. NBC_00059]MCX5411515.1 hypothetical protein [Streptomyces sp. NBC_00059]